MTPCDHTLEPCPGCIERGAASVLVDYGWPFDMYSTMHDTPEMRDAVAAEYERREGPCDPEATWRETIDLELSTTPAEEA